MAVTSRETLRTELNNFTERAYSQQQCDTFTGLFEGDVNLWLGGSYTRQLTAEVTIDENGEGDLPADFVRPIALSFSTYGNLRMVGWDALTDYNPDGSGGVPELWALKGTLIKTAPASSDSVTLDYEARLVGLGENNASNWLLVQAPQAYFWGVYSQAAAFEKDFTIAAGAEKKAKEAIGALGIQLMAAQFGRASLRLRAAP